MKNRILVAIFSLIGISVFSQTNVSGKWNTGEKNTIVKIVKENGAYVGKVISTDNEKIKAGTLLLKDVKLTKGKWSGLLYAPKRGEWYDATLVNKGNKLEIVISVGVMTKKLEWITG